MNEQLIVKNFGPIKDATVDFKRVTVFIGPTGGGKSTLAKLAALFRAKQFLSGSSTHRHLLFKNYLIDKYFQNQTTISFSNKDYSVHSDTNLSFESPEIISERTNKIIEEGFEGANLDSNDITLIKDTLQYITNAFQSDSHPRAIFKALSSLLSKDKNSHAKLVGILTHLGKDIILSEPKYLPAERIFISALEYSWAGLMRDDIGLPKTVLEFANNFSIARKEVVELTIPIFNIQFLHIDGQDFVKIPHLDEPVRLVETASGIQSITPALVVLEYLSRKSEQKLNFIFEEPELNLYPTAQQDLINWLIEKCTKDENSLIITTHSPYILSSCNLLLEAYKVAQHRPELTEDIAAIVPKECWINPDEFAAYYVADGTVKPITDVRTHLIGANELDAISGDIADSFRKLLRLQKQKQPSA